MVIYDTKSFGAQVTGVSQNDPKIKSHFTEINGEELIDTFYFDIRNLSLLREIIELKKPDYIFHLAAQAIVSDSFKDPLNTFTTNAIGSINILESLRLTNCKCTLIMITSDKVYENKEWVFGGRENDRKGGSDPYSASKACAELAINSYFKSFNQFKSKLCIARAGNVIEEEIGLKTD